MIKLELSEQEAILTRDALTEAKISLRTIHIPGKDDKVLTEENFLNADISDRKRSNYFAICDVLTIINLKVK